MGKRESLQLKLETIIDITEPNGDKHVYFNSPSGHDMVYPAIRYNIKTINGSYANNSVFLQQKAYELTLIDRNPDSVYIEKILQLPYCKFDRFYPANNLNHWTFTLYY